MDESFLGKIACCNYDDRDKYQYFCNMIEPNGDFACADVLNIEKNRIIKRIGQTILTGDEDWFFDKNTKTYFFYQNNKFYKNIGGKYDPMMCTHARWTKYTESIEYSYIQGGEKNEIMFNYDYGKDGIDNFKKWLKEQFDKNIPVKILYIMQNPKIIDLGTLHKLNPRFNVHSIEILNEVKPTIEYRQKLIFDTMTKNNID